MSAKRLKMMTLLALALGGGVALMGTTQVWYTIALAPGAASVDSLAVTGQQISPALSSLGLAALALAAALTIAGRVFRYVLGTLALVIGGTLTWLSVGMITDPQRAVIGEVRELTGLSGGSVEEGLIASIAPTVWPMLSCIAGVLVVVAGLVVLVFSAKWGRAGRKYEAHHTPAEAGPRDRISDWDSLSDGEDPSDSAEEQGSTTDASAEGAPGEQPSGSDSRP